MVSEKPLPVQDGESEPYWSGAKEHRLRLPRCMECGKHHFYPRELCPHCWSDRIEWRDASGRGVIYSYTIARRPAGPAFKEDTPYAVAIVELEEGPRMMSNIVTGNVESIRVGDRVHHDRH